MVLTSVLHEERHLSIGKAICRRSDGYNLTEGKEYEITRVEPRSQEQTAGGFTWPEYAHTTDDAGRRIVCHATRFVNKA